MRSDDGGIYYSIELDNSRLRRDAQQAISIFGGIGDRAEAEGSRIDTAFRKAGQAVAAYFTAQQLTGFIRSIVQVRGEFQQLEVAFRTMLGSKEQADSLMAQLVETAAKTPFDLQGVANGAKQLLAYGVAAEDVNGTLTRLGDIAAGLSIPLGDLVYLYGTTMAQGRLYTQDLNQFVGRGIPMIQELAGQFGVAESKVRELVEAGQVGFPEVRKAIESLTNEGGRFGGLMEAQSKTITGRISNIEDSISTMFNKIGKANEGVINDAISGVSYLVENYEKVGEAIAVAATAYGSYKAVLMTVSAIQSANNLVLRQAVLEKGLATAAGIRLSNAEAVAAARTKLLALAQQGLAKALKATAAATLLNPYMWLAAAVTGLAYGMYKLVTYQTEAEKAQEKLNESMAEAEKSSLAEEVQLARLKGQLSALEKGTREYDAVKSEIVAKFGKYYSGLDEEISKVGLTEQAYRKLTDAIRKSFGARQYEKFASEQQSSLESTMADTLKKIQDRLYEKLGDEYGAKIYEQIRQGIIEKQFGLGNELHDITGLGKDLSAALDKVAGKEGGLFDFTNRAVEGYISNILKAERLAEEMDSKAKARFGIREGNTGREGETGESEVRQSTYADDYKAARKEWETAKKELEAIERDKDKFSSKQYEDAKKRKEGAEKAYKDLGGNTSGKPTEEYKAQEDARKYMDKVLSELEQMRMDHQQAEIDLMQEGTEKKIAQINLDYDKEIAAVLAKEKEWKDAQGGKLTKEQTVEIRTALVDSYVSRERKASNASSEQAESERRAMDEYLKEYGTYMEKRRSIIDMYNAQTAKATTEGERLSLAANMKKELSELDVEANKSTAAISRMFDDMAGKTVEDMRKIADAGEQALQFLIAGEWDEEKGVEFGMSQETFDTLRESPAELERIRKAIRQVRDEADKSDTAFGKMASGLRKAFAAGDDATKLKEGLGEIESGLGDVMQSGQFLADTLSSLGDTFGGTFGGIAEGLTAAMDTVNSAMSGAQAGSMFGPIGAAAGAAIGVVTSLSKAIGKIHDAKNEKRIQRLQEQVDTLTTSYDKLGRAVEDAYSKDASGFIEQQNELLEQQRRLIEQQIKEEEDKKKTDDDRIKDWRQQLEDISQTIEDNREAAVDAIFGEDVQSAIESFVDAYTDAWANNEDRAESAKDTVKKMMRQMVTESIKAAMQSSNGMEQIRKKLQEFYADNVLSGWEQDYIYGMAEELQEELDRRYGWADGLMKDESPGESEQSATSRGFEAMSQDSADELNGRFTAIQISTEEIKSYTLQISDDTRATRQQVVKSNEMMAEIREISLLSLSWLESIEKNTRELYTMNERLGMIEKNTRNI